MKKFIATLLLLVFCCSFCLACNSSEGKEYDDLVNSSISEIKAYWEDLYNRNTSRYENCKKEIIIKNTRIVIIKEETEIEEFREIKYIVEFVLFVDCFGSNGKYYLGIDLGNSVAIKKDNSFLSCELNMMKSYSSRYYDYSYPMIQEVIDLGAKYNQTIALTVE